MTISLSKLENILYLLYIDNEKDALMYLQECAQPREKISIQKEERKVSGYDFPTYKIYKNKKPIITFFPRDYEQFKPVSIFFDF